MSASAGVNRLARAVRDRIRSQTQREDQLELGTIQSDYGLKLDRFPHVIPKSDYLVCRTLTLPIDFFTITPNKNDPGGSTPWPAADDETYEIEGKHPHGTSGTHGGHSSGDGTHAHPDTEGAHWFHIQTPLELRPLFPGDRVLVAWVNDGTDPVIVDVVVPGSKIKTPPRWEGP